MNRKRKQRSKKNESDKPNTEQHIQDGDDSDPDEETKALLEAAGAWAKQSETEDMSDIRGLDQSENDILDSPRKKKRSLSKLMTVQSKPSLKVNQYALETTIPRAAPTIQERADPLSLHVTRLPFDLSVSQLWRMFEGASKDFKSNIKSVRFVYDQDQSTGDRKFRGVAFVDVADKKSYDAALSMHRTKLTGTAINVRPTKTKSELQEIIERTKEMVQTLKKPATDESPEKKKIKKCRDGVKKEPKKKKKKNKPGKKQRARKAAILRSDKS